MDSTDQPADKNAPQPVGKLIISMKPYITVNGVQGMCAARVYEDKGEKTLYLENTLGGHVLTLPFSLIPEAIKLLQTQRPNTSTGICQAKADKKAAAVIIEAAIAATKQKCEFDAEGYSILRIAECVSSGLSPHNARHRPV